MGYNRPDYLLKGLMAVLALAIVTIPARALDLTSGLMYAVPTPGGKAPTIDGSLRDWDLSGAEPIWIAPETAKRFHATVALMYDEDALYAAAQISLPGRPIHNPNNPVDAFWWGDELELRLAADPTLPAPLDQGSPAVKASDRIAHLTFWKNSETGKDYLNITYGVGLGKGSRVNPAGSQVVIHQGLDEYTVESRVPWSALNVPGGKNPFVPGQKMTAVWGVHWGGETQTAALYRTNPGSFAFNQAHTWGQVEFSPAGHLKPRHESLAKVLAALSAPARPVGVPITINLPRATYVSVNIFDSRGGIVRELIGGERHPRGKLTIYWDGRDQWGLPVSPGKYRWGAYFSGGLRAEYMGEVGESGHPPYETADGRGGWGADHGPCIDVAADSTGLYFLWTSAEDGRAIVKTDYKGTVLWRKTPFVGGGFGPHFAVAANGKTVFLTFGENKPQLLRLDAATGQLLTWPNGSALTSISESAAVPVPEDSSPIGSQPETAGLACRGREVFAPVYSQNTVRVLDSVTGGVTRELSCPGPRGLCVDWQGNLYVVSYPTRNSAAGPARVLRFDGAQGNGETVVGEGLDAPWDVAVDRAGRIEVTDLGASQQIKVFSPIGRLITAWGKRGGRTRAGAYDGRSFLRPAGIASDSQGGVLVAEASPPKVMSRLDARTGKVLNRWYGGIGYSAMTWPDPSNPWTAYYVMEGPESFGRATIPAPGANGAPDAYWDLPDAGIEAVGTMVNNIGAPYVLFAENGKKYMVSDTSPHGICLAVGDQMLPVGHAQVFNANTRGNTLGKPYLQLWTDLNGDHRLQPGETTILDTVRGQPLPEMNDTTGSLWMARNGDLYLVTRANEILEIPAAGFEKNGAIRWNAARASFAVPTVLPSMGRSLFTGWRAGIAGVRRDSQGNLYTAFSTVAPALTPELSQELRKAYPDLPRWDWGAYASPTLAAQMHEGLGHTGESNAVKFAKFDPSGRLIWMTGRKATSAAKPGEMYHFWVLGGLVGDDYISGASEWGQIYFYTHDGFYVGALMNNPGLAPSASPYTFGSETFGMRVQYVPKRDEVWAYASGRAYRVAGFKHGRVVGEQRIYGTVTLKRVYDTGKAEVKAGPLQIVRLSNPLRSPGAWQAAPVSEIRRNGAPLASAQFGYDERYLYGRVHVVDSTPLQNVADTASLAFNGGDAVVLDLGPGRRHERPGPGDARILAAKIGGRARLIAMKPITTLLKRPEHYLTPSGGDVHFDYVGEVPGGVVMLTPDPDGHGYTALFAIPRSFIETPLSPGTTLSGDVEVLRSGQGALGLQTLSRSYLFAPANTQTTMINDIPTEARLYPQYWGKVVVK